MKVCIQQLQRKCFIEILFFEKTREYGTTREMLQSRKIVSVKVLSDSPELYVKSMIKKSYGTQLRPAVVYFNGLTPAKAHCSCPVGASGLCYHVFALLLFS